MWLCELLLSLLVPQHALVVDESLEYVLAEVLSISSTVLFLYKVL